jgi:hypothetical protein
MLCVRRGNKEWFGLHAVYVVRLADSGLRLNATGNYEGMRG